MTFPRDTSVPSDNFFFKENSLLSLFPSKKSSPASSRVPSPTASVKSAPLEKAEDTRSITSSDGHTSDSDGEASSTGWSDSAPTVHDIPDCFPVPGFGQGYTDNLKDVRAATKAALNAKVELLDAKDYGSIEAFALSRIEAHAFSGSFLICNLAEPIRQLNLWRSELPMVEPFYAVKCNPDPAILRVLASLGCGFDCATMGEIDLVLNGLGKKHNFSAEKAAQKIVYANPAKMEHMIEYAIDGGVQMTVFDGEDELHKIASLAGGKTMKLLLRLTTDDKDSVCRFSKKFGCPVGEAEPLLILAQSLGLNVAGVSFHVGSGCGDAGAYTTALDDAAAVFAMADALGMPAMSIIDIGGGFPGDSTIYGEDRLPDFKELAAAIRTGIASFLQKTRLPTGQREVRFIAEPGRFFVSACTSIVTKVYSRKGGQQNYQALYVDDGVYGSFNNVVYDHALPRPAKLTHDPNVATEETIPTAVFGPTCDGLDQMCSLESTKLQRCSVGDWLIWENQGAYTHTASFVFNGYTHVPNKVYCTL